MGETAFINKLLPGFAQIGFAKMLNQHLYATNQTAVRANLPALVATLNGDGVVVTADATAPDLIDTWNGLCDDLNLDPTITLHDYQNCYVETVVDFGVKWKQICVALDREEALSQSYAATFGSLVVPFWFQ